MKLKEMIKKATLSNIRNYCQGNIRYKIYYSRFRDILLRVHIVQQIEYRIQHMDSECFNNGECKICGCATTALQMCDKSCKKPCYPPMLSAKQWKMFKSGQALIILDHKTPEYVTIWTMQKLTDKPLMSKHTTIPDKYSGKGNNIPLIHPTH